MNKRKEDWTHEEYLEILSCFFRFLVFVVAPIVFGFILLVGDFLWAVVIVITSIIGFRQYAHWRWGDEE